MRIIDYCNIDNSILKIMFTHLKTAKTNQNIFFFGASMFAYLHSEEYGVPVCDNPSLVFGVIGSAPSQTHAQLCNLDN